MEQVLFRDGLFQWKRLENLIVLAREQVTMMNRNVPLKTSEEPTNGNRYFVANLKVSNALQSFAYHACYLNSLVSLYCLNFVHSADLGNCSYGRF